MSGHEAIILNMDDLAVKRRFMQKVQLMTGLWEMRIRPRRLTRSLSQNAYYFAAIVQPFTEWLKIEWGDSDIRPDQAHELLKHRILGVKELVNKQTGEMIEITRSSRQLDTAEFAEFIDKAAAWLAEFCGLVILPPEMFKEGSTGKRTMQGLREAHRNGDRP